MDVRLEQVSMRFKQVKALDEITLTIRSGEMTALLGPSGCGKSTTLFLLAGLYRPTDGRIWFGGEEVTSKEPEHRGIGMVFQNYALYPHMTVFKNILYPLKMNKVPKEEAVRRAREMAELVHIGHLLDRKPGQLSGGQQQRVAIARALVKKPRLLLLDEPLSNLDARLRLEMREEIRRIQSEVGITTVFVTHDQEEAMSISDRILLMDGGRIQQDAAPNELYREPGNLFAAQFIGMPKMNLLDFDPAGGGEAERAFVQENLPGITGKVKLGIRAEDLAVGSGMPVFEGRIAYRETVGRDTLIRVENGAQSLLVFADRDKPYRIGDRIVLGARPERMHWFDAETGNRIASGRPAAAAGRERA